MKNLWRFGFVVLLIVCVPLANAQSKKGAATPPASGASQPAATPPSPSSGAFESQMLAYSGLDHIAADIAHHICGVSDISSVPTVIIFDQTSFATLQSYEALIANARIVVRAYNTLVSNPTQLVADLRGLYVSRSHSGNAASDEAWKGKIMGLDATGPAIGDPISDATALLSAIAISSNSESAGSITIPDSAMALAITKALEADTICQTAKVANKNIIYPPLFGFGSASDVSSADIQADIQQVDDVRRIAHEDVSKRNTDYIAAHPAAPAVPAVPATSSTLAVPAKPATPGPGDTVLTAALTDVDGLYDNFMNSLLQVNPTTGLVGTISVIQGRQLATLIAGKKNPDGSVVPPAYVLLASIVAAGGTTHQHKTFWTALTTGDKFSYSGGLIVNVALWKASGSSPAYANVIRYRTPLMKLKKPSNLVGIDAGDNIEVTTVTTPVKKQ